MPDLSIIIVSWNVADLLEKCLSSLAANRLTISSSEIILVDSASSDDSVERVRKRFPQVRLLAQEKNLGFSRCNNIGLEAATGSYLLLLNPDTEVLPGALDEMLGYMKGNPHVGIVGPHTLNSDGSTQSTKRRFPTVMTGVFESTWLQKYAPRHLIARYHAMDIGDQEIAEVDWVQGSALMARREVYERIGGFDEGFVMYSEELDWCRRAKMAGWRVVYVGTAQITHHGGKSSEQASARRHIHFHESKLRYYHKYHGPLVAHGLRLFLLANYVWQIGLESTKRLLGLRPELRQARVREYWQVLRSGLKVR